jgi:hypothetical protein
MNVIQAHVRRPPELQVMVGGLLVCLCLSACASRSIANAPPAVAEECRREVADIMATEPAPPLDAALRDEQGPTDTPLDDARTAREELQGPPVSDWPEDALLYRCFVSRGVELTEQQASVIAEWQGRTRNEPSAPPENID